MHTPVPTQSCPLLYNYEHLTPLSSLAHRLYTHPKISCAAMTVWICPAVPHSFYQMRGVWCEENGTIFIGIWILFYRWVRSKTCAASKTCGWQKHHHMWELRLWSHMLPICEHTPTLSTPDTDEQGNETYANSKLERIPDTIKVRTWVARFGLGVSEDVLSSNLERWSFISYLDKA